MAVGVPQQVLNDYLMSRSAMDEPRSVTQRVLDLVFGRTYPEQATNALTGAVGTLLPTSEFMPYMKGALDLLPLRVRALLERSPMKIRISRPEDIVQQGHLAPASFWPDLGGGGHAIIDPEKLLSNEWFGSLTKQGITPQQIIEAAMAHELSHGANKASFGSPRAPFPGVGPGMKTITPAEKSLFERESFPLLVDQQTLRRNPLEGVEVTDLWKALDALEGFYNNKYSPVNVLFPQMKAPEIPSTARQVNRYLMRRTAE